MSELLNTLWSLRDKDEFYFKSYGREFLENRIKLRHVRDIFGQLKDGKITMSRATELLNQK